MNTSSLLNHLRLWQKFAILTVISLLLAALPTVMYINVTATSLEREKAGMSPAAAVLKVIQLTQQHRGMSALFLGDVEGAKDKREAKQRDVEQAMANMNGIVKGIPDKAIDALWLKVQQDWEGLRNAVTARTLASPQSFANHTALLANLLTLNELVADYFGLNLDPDKVTYQLIQSMYYNLPRLAEETGKVRARGSALLSKKAATQADKLNLATMIAQVNDRLLQTRSSFDKAAIANPAFAARFDAGVKEMSTASVALMQLTNEKNRHRRDARFFTDRILRGRQICAASSARSIEARGFRF